MFKSALFGRKKTAAATAPGDKPFADFYNDWLAALTTALLPQLRRVLSSLSTSPALLSTHVEVMHNHFLTYYEALDHAAAADVAQCLYPEWRNSLEKPFLWLGDLHPYLFTNLLRSFLDDQEEDEEEEDVEEAEAEGEDNNEMVDDQKEDQEEEEVAQVQVQVQVEPASEIEEEEYLGGWWGVGKTWRSPGKALTSRVDQIECGLRLMVPALAARAREAQAKLVTNVGLEWGGSKEGMKAAVGEAVERVMEELAGVVVDANRLRRSVLADVLSAATVYQAASFLEALAHFLVGFREDDLLREFEACDKFINKY
ncbi:protein INAPERTURATE POLLEN 1 homolog [Andrographis paniculata]|uniref:protein INAPERTURATE POLLEN 1 homolog n=1 Tax=Andrographis paniculata TaxID=175694 RepID=UPI0021E832F1|nr:protein INAPERTURATE POLLEN 1 homolog [Andrographis paniculata]